MWNPVFPVSSQWFLILQACFQLVTEIYCLILLYLLESGLWPSFQSTKMPRATMNSACVMDISVNQENAMISQDSATSDQEMEVQSPQCFPSSTNQPQSFAQPMCMPYIKGPKMKCTVNDSLYHRFLKWKLNCKNILDCELAMLPESKKCKKVIEWSGDFGIDQYVSGCLPAEDLSLDVILAQVWRILQATDKTKLEPDLTCWQASDKETYLSMSGTMHFKLKCLLPSTQPETASIPHRDIFWFFFLKDGEFVSKTINDCNIDLVTFLTSKVRQLAK